MGPEPPERYHITYFVNGIYLLPNGTIEPLGQHEVEIELHSEYPRYKPICRILTPIWHPNFRDGQICIGDIWGAGETLCDIIINIGEMIQYQSWNSFSPLSSEAAAWAIENKHLFPVGTINLNTGENEARLASPIADFDIDILESSDGAPETPVAPAMPEAAEAATEAEASAAPADIPGTLPGILASTAAGGIPGAPSAPVTPQAPASPQAPAADDNDFDITPEELEGIVFVPTAQRTQSTLRSATLAQGGRINGKTILFKGLIWAIIGAFLGFIITEAIEEQIDMPSAIAWQGESELAEAYEYYMDAYDYYYAYYYYAEREGEYSESAEEYYEKSEEAYEKYETAMAGVDLTAEEEETIPSRANCLSTALWSALIALFIGLMLGIGEGVFYGSKSQAVKYGLIGAGLSFALGFACGYPAQAMYTAGLTSAGNEFLRAFCWAVMGVGVGLAIGLIKPNLRRVLFCLLGGFIGAFIGGILFSPLSSAFIIGAMDDGIVGRGIGILLMGGLIGLFIGLLEQAAKAAWLKVIRGEFEGKEYLVFAGLTSIGSTGKNTIVLFRDRMVAPHHCDIVLEGRRYVLRDAGSPLGTIVNGMPVTQHQLRNGDAISIGNSVLVFYTR